MDISVVIPSRDDPAGLYFTYAASQVELERSGLEYEIIAAVDGSDHEVRRALQQHQACRIVDGFSGFKCDSPQASRHEGAKRACGKYIFFLDSHVVPCRGFFNSMLYAAQKEQAAIVFSPHCTWARGVMGYGYGVAWDGNLWSKDHQTKPSSNYPYPVAMMGHGAICVDREKYFRVGGYWQAQRGWGGEESHLSLKFWMLGERCYCDPRIYHWHYMATRRGEAIFGDREHVRNFLISAYALGGQKYLDRCHLAYELPAAARGQGGIYDDLYRVAPEEAAAERELIRSGPFGGDLDKLRECFRKEGIHS